MKCVRFENHVHLFQILCFVLQVLFLIVLSDEPEVRCFVLLLFEFVFFTVVMMVLLFLLFLCVL